MAEFMPAGECSVFFRVILDGPHLVLPVDAQEDAWACYSCGIHFFSDHGYAVCPDDMYRRELR
jgi:hypothetical protein